ncbi:GSO1, partial [Symbiodinium necroappetens]
DIKALEECTDLKLLSLRGATIMGDIRALANMKLLKKVDLRGTQVSGDVKVFEGLAGLRVLLIKRTPVYGDIQAFQASVQLYRLELSGTQVYGDIRAFEATRRLRRLSLTATRISGNIQAFEKTKLLEDLILSLTEVEGDIKAFNTTRRLQQLHLASTNVCGDIVALRGATLLRDIFLRSTNVQGDIEAFVSTSSLEKLMLGESKVSGNVGILNSTAFSKLWKLELDHTNVVGNVVFIGSLPALQVVNLAATRVWGDIDVFGRNKRLEAVYCQNMDLKGDIRSFEHLTLLTYVDMSFTKVAGDVAVFAGKQFLHTLKLASTRVFGDIGDLVSWDNVFEVLELSSTSVAGNVWVFQHASYLKELYLADTQVTGSMDGILHWEKVQVIDLSKTLVEGRLTRRWRGCCKELRTLRLSDPGSGSGVQFIPAGDDRVDLLQLPQYMHPDQAILPALTTLEVSGCQLQGPASDLLLPLAFCEHLGSVLAAESGLTGDLPTTDPLKAFSAGAYGIYNDVRSPLSTSLEVLDLSGNNLSRIAAVPQAMHSIGLSSNKQPLQLAEGVLTKACKSKVLIDLRGTSLDDGSLYEIRKLIETGAVSLTKQQGAFVRPSKGYKCFDLDRSSTTLQVTPSTIMPHEWCTCLRGWSGVGTNCTECPENFFSHKPNLSSCTPCPAHTKSSKRSKDVHDCKCQVGSLHRVKGEWLCGCPDDQALLNDNCVPCPARHLNCSGYSSNATTAQPLPGYARLELKADEAFQCLDRKRCPGDGRAASGLGCGSGYDGPLCTGCHETFFAAGNSCLPCSNKDQHIPARVIHAMACVTIVALLWAGVVAVAYFVYSWRPGQWLEAQLQTLRQAVFAEGVVGSLQEKLLKSQAPILLQMCQLWVVLAVLARNKEEDGHEASSSRLWELPYMQTLQFAIGNLQELLYLQCYLGGPPVRLALAILTPVLPLALLLCSSGIEVFRRGAGVSAALKVLPIFFIGGASKCFALRSCQLFDAGGEPLENFAFLRQLPDLRCDQDVAWADSSPVSSVFWPCAICYGILIPCFLFYLYFRQHVLLRYSRVPLQLTQGGKEQHLAVGVQDRMLERRVVAAAVAYIAMMQQGTVRIQLRSGKGRLGER